MCFRIFVCVALHRPLPNTALPFPIPTATPIMVTRGPTMATDTRMAPPLVTKETTTCPLFICTCWPTPWAASASSFPPFSYSNSAGTLRIRSARSSLPSWYLPVLSPYSSIRPRYWYLRCPIASRICSSTCWIV